MGILADDQLIVNMLAELPVAAVVSINLLSGAEYPISGNAIAAYRRH